MRWIGSEGQCCWGAGESIRKEEVAPARPGEKQPLQDVARSVWINRDPGRTDWSRQRRGRETRDSVGKCLSEQ